MDLGGLRIGYVPYSEKLDRPGDRRRFCYYADKRSIKFDIIPAPERYGLVVVTERGDLSRWHRFPKDNGKVIFDFPDSYLATHPGDMRGMMRGIAKFVVRQDFYLHLSYHKLLEAMCRRADAVVCTTEEQRDDIFKFCPNTHVILDFHSMLVQKRKTDYSSGKVFNFVWEGMAQNLSAFSVIQDALEEISKRHRIALHLITDLEYPLALHNWGRAKTSKLVRRVIPFDEVYLYEWNEGMLATISTACDLALLPIPLDIPFVAGKPENKLLLFWRMGVPVLASATSAYTRAMEACGLPMTCRTTEDWIRAVERYIAREEERRDAGQSGLAYTERWYNEEALLKKWDDVVTSVF